MQPTYMWGHQQQIVDETQQNRLKQIDSLKQYFSSLKEVTKDFLYEIPVNVPVKKTGFVVRINLSKDFPKVPPVVQILPGQHKLLDQNGVVLPTAHPALAQWHLNQNLGKLVSELVNKFIQDPPIVLTPINAVNPNVSNPPSYNNYPTNNGPYPPNPNPSMLTNSGMNPNPAMNPNTLPVKTTPPAPSKPLPPNPVQLPLSFPELDSMSAEDIRKMLNDEAEFKAFFDQLAPVKELKKLRDDLRAANEALASKNLAKEAEIQSLRSEIAPKQSNALEKKQAYDMAVKKQQEVMKQYSSAAVLEQLGKAVNDAENESDFIAQKFLAGEMELKDFQREFFEKRKLFHLRAAKKERMSVFPTK